MVSKKSEEDALLLSLESIDDSWVLDLGDSFHATLHRGYFIDYYYGVQSISNWEIVVMWR